MVHAEKIVTTIVRGITSTRWRDFADLYLLARHHPIYGARPRRVHPARRGSPRHAARPARPGSRWLRRHRPATVGGVAAQAAPRRRTPRPFSTPTAGTHPSAEHGSQGATTSRRSTTRRSTGMCSRFRPGGDTGPTTTFSATTCKCVNESWPSPRHWAMITATTSSGDVTCDYTRTSRPATSAKEMSRPAAHHCRFGGPLAPASPAAHAGQPLPRSHRESASLSSPNCPAGRAGHVAVHRPHPVQRARLRPRRVLRLHQRRGVTSGPASSSRFAACSRRVVIPTLPEGVGWAGTR